MVRRIDPRQNSVQRPTDWVAEDHLFSSDALSMYRFERTLEMYEMYLKLGGLPTISVKRGYFVISPLPPPPNGRKSLILAPPDISGYQWGFGCQFVKAYITENPVTNQKIL